MSHPHRDNTLIVIPARMKSARLPGKPLADIAGEAMIVRVWRRFVLLAPSERERSRRLGQMRALDAGMTIAVARVDSAPCDVDTPADLARVRAMIEASGNI
jgi:CMP-2-keto-3-deoxyoctulosonic acid synthetase